MFVHCMLWMGHVVCRVCVNLRCSGVSVCVCVCVDFVILCVYLILILGLMV